MRNGLVLTFFAFPEEKLKLKQTKADVSDFTSDIKKLLEKLNTDIKEKLKKPSKEN